MDFSRLANGKYALLLKSSNDFRCILASGSPRRKELFSLLGIPFGVHVSDFEENLDKVALEPKEYTRLTAIGKAVKAASDLNDKADLLVSADTIVSFENEIIEKPIDRADAKRMLKAFEGKSVTVLTGVCLLFLRSRFPTLSSCQDVADDSSAPSSYWMKSFVQESSIEFGIYEDDLLEAYLDTNEAYDKSGAIGYQGTGSLFCKGITGCYPNVVGLPVYEIFREIKSAVEHLEK